MKFLVDENVGLSVVNFLRDKRYGVVSVCETLRSTKDRVILNKAVEENRIIITNDKDFGDLVFNLNLPHKGIVLMRLEDESAKNKLGIISKVLDQYKDQLPNNFTVVTEEKIRIRHSM